MTGRGWWTLWTLLALLACYHAPWFAHESAGFTMHAYDLAEWSSLHPAVRSSSPAMLTSFLLRAPLFAVVFGLALAANWFVDARVRWTVRAVELIVALRFVPPKEFFTAASDDPNYRQMALLAALSVIAILAAFGVGRLRERAQTGILGAAIIASIVAGWWGLSRAGELLRNFEIDVHSGMGIVTYTVIAAAAVIVHVWLASRQRMRLPRDV